MDGTPSIDSHAVVTPAREPPRAIFPHPPPHDNNRSHITGIEIMPTYKEVVSGARPYLPAADPTSWHFPGPSGRFDRQFRLLREESLGQVRHACREVLQAVRGPGLEAYRRQQTSTRFGLCDDANIHHMTMHEENGLEFVVALRQPEQVRHLTDGQRRDWWRQCNRFRPGTLVCALHPAGYIAHFVVSDSTRRLPADMPDNHAYFDLSGDRQWVYVNLKLVESSQNSGALFWYTNTPSTHIFLDFPDVSLASFKYTLEALQRDCQSPHLLVSVLSGHSSVSGPSQEIAAPAYARSPDFAFSLECLTPHGRSFQFRPTHASITSEACSLSDLEPSQARALLASLSREVALVGGLPGIGKSYLARKIIKVLLCNRENAGLGPILFIFRDGTALDRMVNQLLDDGAERIVRMGGSSTSERLQNLNLPVTSYTLMGDQDRQDEDQIKQSLDTLVSDTRHDLMWRYDIYPLEAHPELIRGLLRRNQQCEDIRSQLRHIHDNPRRQVLHNAHVVAVTTTELARNPELLQPTQAKVLLCDDADELQESHILTAILPSVEHIILIGNETVQSERLQQMTFEGVPIPTEMSFFERLHSSANWNCPRLSLVRNPALTGDSPPICGRSLPDCVHSCQLPRHGDSECGPCEQPCDVRCSHARCEKLCHEPCAPCTEDYCASGCPHSQCTMPCAAPCNWVPCSRRCTMLLDCGHQCPSLCGEGCPDSKYCQTCGPEDLRMTPMVSSSGIRDYRDIDLNEDPCIFPRCGHFQTRSPMDDELRIQDFYNLDGDGIPSSVRAALKPFSIQEVPRCTRCRSSFREICRYGRVIRGPMIDESLEEFLTWRSGKFRELVNCLAQRVPASNPHKAYNGLRSHSFLHQHDPVELRKGMLDNMFLLNDLVGEGRYRGLNTLFTDIRKFFYGELKPKQEVFQKLFGSGKRRNENNSSSTAHFTDANRLLEPPLELHGDIFGLDLFLRCNIAVLDDFLRLWSRHPAASTSAVSRPTLDLDLVRNLRFSQHFIRKAQAAKSHMITAQGHVYFSWYCGFALAMGVNASTRERQSGRPVGGEVEIPASQEEFKRSAEQHLAEADRLSKTALHTSRRLMNAIEATRDFVRSRNQGSLRVNGTLWYKNITGVFERSGPWYVCDNGHPFMDVRKPSMFLGQLRCNDCGLIVAGRERASAEEASLDVAVAAPPQDEVLIDI